MNRQVAHIWTMAITVVGEVLPRTVKGSVNVMPGQTTDKLRTKCGQSQIQPPFQDLAPGCKQPSPDNKHPSLERITELTT